MYPYPITADIGQKLSPCFGQRAVRCTQRVLLAAAAPLRIHIPHRRGIDKLVTVGTVNILGRVLLHPPAEDWGAAMVAGYRCSVFGIAVVDAAGHTNVAIATAPFTGASRQQNFIDGDHKSPNISISMENDNARGRRNQTAGGGDGVITGGRRVSAA